MKKTYDIKFSFTQSVEGQVRADSVSEVYETLTKDFSDAPDFRIVTVKEAQEITSLSPEPIQVEFFDINSEKGN